MNMNDLENKKITISVAGETVDVNASDPVKDTLKRILHQKGIDSFTILVDGDEVDSTEDLPEHFGEHDIEVKRYVKPGC